MLKAVLFDLDQTLIDWEQVTEPWEQYVQRNLKGVLDHVNAEIHPLNGIELIDFFEAHVATVTTAWKEGVITLRPPHIARVLAQALITCGVPKAKLDTEARAQVYQAYEDHWVMPAGERAYPDVLVVLPELAQHNIELGIITNASHPMQQRDHELAQIGILDYFPRCRVSAADVGWLKPHQAIFEQALNLLAIEPDEAVFIGDNLHADVGGAQRVGMRGVWRINSAEQEAQQTADLDIVPDGKINTLHELLPLLDEWYPDWRHNGR
ncbi:MAG: HAD family hydrolase [Anaerolineae bacterium]|nr:HAD family hydrolase [Anaerolineae bacterium]